MWSLHAKCLFCTPLQKNMWGTFLDQLVQVDAWKISFWLNVIPLCPVKMVRFDNCNSKSSLLGQK